MSSPFKRKYLVAFCLFSIAPFVYSHAQDKKADDPPKPTNAQTVDKSAASKVDKADNGKADVEDFVYLDDLTERLFEVDFGTLGKHGATGFPAIDVQRCRLNPGGIEVTHGLSMAPKDNLTKSSRSLASNATRKSPSPSHVVYDLGKRYHTFRTTAAINFPTAEDGLERAKKEAWKGWPESPIKFRVFGDGKLLWESRGMQKHGESQECEVNIEGVEQLRMEVSCAGSARFTWSFWAYPRVTFKAKTSLAPTSVLNALESAKSLSADMPTNIAKEEKDTVSSKELAKQLTDKVGLLAKKKSNAGKVAKVTPQVVYVNMGNSSGIRVGNALSVFRNMGEIKDPVTGAALGTERPLISQLEVTEVNVNYSKAKIVSKLEAQIEIGDEVESKNEMAIAVCPIRNEDGKLTNQGSAISEEITTSLVEAGLKVVERSVLNSALRELLVQNTFLFESKSAQNLGELTGANYVVTGKIVTNRDTGTAFVRLVDVSSGEIILAASAALSSATMSSASLSPGKAPLNADGKSNPNADNKQPAANSGHSSLVDGLPSFLTTSSMYKRVPGKGIRIQGHDKFALSEQGAIRTKEIDFLNRDFTFEVVVAFKAGDRGVSIGLGPGIADQSYNGLKDCVYLRLNPKGQSNGEVQIERFKLGSESVGRVSSDGPHLVRIVKEGEKVLFQIDAGNDGTTDDDLETTILNIREFAPFLHAKNMPLFFGGSGEFINVSLK